MKDFKTALSENNDNYELYLGVYETLSKYGMNDQGKEYLDNALKLKAKLLMTICREAVYTPCLEIMIQQ